MNPIGQSFYLDQAQCELLGCSYDQPSKLVCSAEAILKSRPKGYDQSHRVLLEPLGGATLIATGTGYGWFKIIGWEP